MAEILNIMKVILLQDVAKTGRKMEVVEVPNGYALNQLIPKGLAKPAIPENLKKLKGDLDKAKAERAEIDSVFSEVAEALAEEKVTVSAEVNEQGHLFAALKSDAIAGALQEKNGKVTARMIEIREPIKEVGEHTVYLVNGEEKVPVTVEVVSNK